MGEFRMPSLGADMTEGTLLEWQVHPGDVVHRGDVVAVVDTDKAAIDVEVFEDGTIEELLVAPGTKVPVGTPLARLAGAQAPPVVKPPVVRPTVVRPPVVTPPVVAPPTVPLPAVTQPAVTSPIVRHTAHTLGVDLTGVTGTGPQGAITRRDVVAAAGRAGGTRASPRARRLAKERGVDLTTVSGTGPGGAVTAGDLERGEPPQPPVQRAVQPRAEHEAASRREAGIRAVGALMARSKREIPHYYVSTTIDMSRAVDWLGSTNADRPVTERVVPAALVLKAAALAVRAVPEMNGWWVDDAFAASEHVHLAVAVSLRGGGLVAPAILDADLLSVDDLMHRLQDVVSRARAGRLHRRELTDATLTVTNLGDQGAEEVYGVIFAPQVALIGVGRIVERPWAHDGMVGARPTVRITVSGDHRVSEGHRASRFLARIDELLQKPEEL